jgi:hypothetical protein
MFLEHGEVRITLADMQRHWAGLLPLRAVDAYADSLQAAIVAAFPGAVIAPAKWTFEIEEVPREEAMRAVRGMQRPMFHLGELKVLDITWGAWAWQVSVGASFFLPAPPSLAWELLSASASGKVLRQPGFGGGAGMRLDEWRPAMTIPDLLAASAAEMGAFCTAMKYQGAQF